jgi:para-aminobenzoate synthetase/4-amino-4-deoxychorismate lyase
MNVSQVALQTGDHWLAFRQPVRVLQATALPAVQDVMRQVEQAVEAEGLYAAGFLSYEAAPAFDRALRVQAGSETPLAWFGLFRAPDLLADLEAGGDFTIGSWQPAIGRDRYIPAIDQIKAQIAQGNTYQVNFTFPLHATFTGDPWGLFVRLAEAQRASYAAYVDTGRHVICSASPELFFHLGDGVLTSRPMKGTAARGRTLAEDEAQAAWLRASEKNRAENVMIVDMIRNDMGRVAEWGSVAAPSLFDAERYPTLWQMTSMVTARTRASRFHILQALFPCASITGAPKVRTMEIIAGLEPAPRGVYTGAIGWMAPGGRAQFNVAIRTVVIDRLAGQATYGVGSGVVWDSDADREYEECLLKAQVLTARAPDFDLLETLRWTPEEGYFLLDRHMQRLRDSAAYFAIPLDLAAAQQALAEAVASLPSQPQRVRLLVDQAGRCRTEAAPGSGDFSRFWDAQTPEAVTARRSPSPVRVGLAPTPVDSTDVFLYHKTTRREVYDAALRSRPDCDDVLLWNERGEVTESCIANVALGLDGRLVTPPVGCGLLAGTLRGLLLEQGRLAERVITLADLARCDGIYLLNSVRGWREAALVT